jgi:hypothetical protein
VTRSATGDPEARKVERAVYRPSEDEKQTESTGKAKKSHLPFPPRKSGFPARLPPFREIAVNGLEKPLPARACGFESHALRKTLVDL